MIGDVAVYSANRFQVHACPVQNKFYKIVSVERKQDGNHVIRLSGFVSKSVASH